jgi:hypothetical protein
MLLVFTKKQTPRIVYTFKHICTHMLGVEVKFTSKIEDFIGHDGPKMSYGRQPLGNELFFQNVPLLFEQGFSDIEPTVQEWGSTVGFFKVTDKSALPYDIFAASFYLLSRYEEYSPHVKDSEGRFPATESLAYKSNFIHQPVVDFWVERFRSVLKERFNTITFKNKLFKLSTIVAVEEAYKYKRKGIMRSVVGGLRDLVTLRLGSVFNRLRTLFFLKKDDYDVFEKLVDFSKKHNVKFKYMFQLSDFSAKDRNVNHNRKNFHSLIKSMADYNEVGLLSGHNSTIEKSVLRKEKKRLENIMNRPLKSMLNAKYPMNLPETQNHIADLEIPHTFSMGYPEYVGFRANTCSPFLFYDINLERVTPVRLHPYVFNSLCVSPENFKEVSEKLLQVKSAINRLEGEMNLVFNNVDFSTQTTANAYLDLIIQLNET